MSFELVLFIDSLGFPKVVTAGNLTWFDGLFLC